MPIAGFFGIGSVLASVEGGGAPHVMGWFNLLWWVIALGAPVLGGYIAGRLAKAQPLLHGCVVGVLGTIAVTLMASPWNAAVMSGFVFVPGGIVGGWLSGRGRKVQSAV